MLYNAIRNNIVYKGQTTLDLPTGDPVGFGHSLVFITPNITCVENIVETKYLKLVRGKYRYFYTDTKFFSKIGHKMVRINKTQEFVTNIPAMFSKYNIKARHPRNAGDLFIKSKNNIYDLSTWFTVYFTNRRKGNAKKLANDFFAFFKGKLDDPKLANYTKHIMIPMDNWTIPGKKFGIKADMLDNPISMLLWATYKNDLLIKELGDVEFIFFSPTSNTFMKLLVSDLIKGNYNRIVNNFKRFPKIVMSSEVDNPDSIEDEPDEEDEKDQVKDIIKTQLTNRMIRRFTGPDVDNPEPPSNTPVTKNDISQPPSPPNKPNRNVVQKKTPNVVDLTKPEKVDKSKNVIKDKAKPIVTEEEDDIELEDLDEIPDYMLEVPDEPEDEEKDSEEIIEDADAEEIEDIVDKFVEDDMIAGKTDEEINRDLEELIKQKKYVDKLVPKQTQANIQRNKELVEIQKKSLPSIDKLKSLIIEETDLSKNTKVTNKNLLKSSFVNFDKNYNEKKLEDDIDNTVKHLNFAGVKCYVIKKEVKDTSDPMNQKKTYSYVLEDEYRVRHNIKFDVPTIIDDKFVFINGSKKIIQKQLMMKPIVKTGPDTVQICTFYKKIFVTRVGMILEDKPEKLKKYLIQNSMKYSVTVGNVRPINRGYSTSLEFDALARNISEFKFANGDIFVFNIPKLIEDLKSNGITEKLDFNKYDYIGYNVKSKTLFKLDKNSGDSVADYIISKFNANELANLQKEKSGSRYMYSSATLMAKDIPLILLACYCEGLSTVLKKAKIKHYFSDKNISKDETATKGSLQFSDGYLIWDKYPIENSILMNGFSRLPTKVYKYSDMDGKDVFIDFLSLFYPQRAIAFIFDNFYDFMIDEKSKEILEMHKQPTDFVSVLIYANNLLANNNYRPENDMINARVRSSEIMAQFVYGALANAFSKYRQTLTNKNPTKISIPPNIIYKELNDCPLLEDVSVLNPVLEAEKSRAISPKGPTGINKEEAYKLEKRAYDKSMLGVLGVSTSPDAGVGIVRQLTLEPKITSTEGDIGITDMKDVDKLTSANLFTPSELLTPLGVIHDDAQRTSMAYKQTKAMLPVVGSTPVLIGNGVERIIPHHLSNEFAFVAKEDGTVIDMNKDYCIIRYKSGKTEAIETNTRIRKHGAGGIYIDNTFKVNVKKGDTFKAKDILAYNERAYSGNSDGTEAIGMNLGVLMKVAVMPSYDLYEDSTSFTKKASLLLSADMVDQKDVQLGRNAHIERMVKIGDKVNSGDELIVFDQSFDDPEVNDFLESIRDKLDETIIASGKTKIKSKKSGTIIDIKIYAGVELEDMSESLRNIVSAYYKGIDKKNQFLNKYKNKDDNDYYKCGQILSETSGKMVSMNGKIKGRDLSDGVLIEFYIKYRDVVKKGDKVTHYAAVKGTCSHVIPEGKEPVSEYRPEEEISTLVSPLAILARKTPSVLVVGCANKVLIETKRQLAEEYKKYK